jgi:hypothetical protein
MATSPSLAPASPYAMHVLALGRMLEWLRQAHQLRIHGTVRESVLTLDDALSQRFAFGFPKRAVQGPKPQPFLGIQRTERAWMHPMQWKGAYVKPNDRRLYLVTATLASEDARNPTIPSFAVGITVNDPEKLNLLFRERAQPKLDGREMWLEDNDTTHINLRQALFSIPLTLLDERSPIPLESATVQWEGATLQDRAIQQMQNNATPNTPTQRTSPSMSMGLHIPGKQ